MNKILIVDDQEQNRYLLKTLLTANGYQVAETSNGTEALSAARSNPPDMIISDILMPVMDGFSLCKAWNRDDALRSIPFVFYTATYTDPKDEELALSLGAARFIVKPMEIDEFVSILSQVMADVESGRSTVTEKTAPEESIYYKLYNEALIRKLEDKMLELEKVNRELEDDIERRKQAEEKIQYQLHQLRSLHAIDRAITASFDVRIILDVVLQQVITQLSVDAGAVLFVNSQIQMMEYAASRGFRSKVTHNAQRRLDKGLANRAVLERRTIHIPDLRDPGTEVVESFSLNSPSESFVSYFGTPLIVKGEIIGVLEIYHRAPLYPDADWLEFLETLAGQTAIAIDNAQMFGQLQRSHMDLMMAYDATIEGWSHAMDLRDKEINGHTQRVTALTLRLADAIGLSKAEQAQLRRGALLHDIGKLGIPDAILQKVDKLTDEEWKIMQQHPAYAFEMLSPIEYLRPALDVPYCHHEKWDGTGYPRKLKAQEIPLAARIFAVVDVWDALTSDRPYRPAWSKEKALEYIREQSGHHFEPRIVAAFLQLLENH